MTVVQIVFFMFIFNLRKVILFRHSIDTNKRT